MILVELLNLTFEHEPSREPDSNVKFAPLGASLRWAAQDAVLLDLSLDVVEQLGQRGLDFTSF